MFGYIRPVKGELLVKDSEFYSSVYCGLCHYGGKNISHLTRWLLNYDFVLLALLRMALTDEQPCVERKRCPYKLKKKSCVCCDGVYDYVCSVFAILTYGKLEDDIRDEKGFTRLIKRAARPIFARIAKKGDKFEGLREAIERDLAAGTHAEEQRVDSPDRAADAFATLMKNVASYGIDGRRKPIAEMCGYHIGRFIYLADALDDIYSDEKSGSYNPLLLKYGSADGVLNHADEISETLQDSLNAFSNTYALAASTPLTATDRLVFNIIELGGRDAVKRINSRNSERKKENEKSV